MTDEISPLDERYLNIDKRAYALIVLVEKPAQLTGGQITTLEVHLHGDENFPRALAALTLHEVADGLTS